MKIVLVPTLQGRLKRRSKLFSRQQVAGSIPAGGLRFLLLSECHACAIAYYRDATVGCMGG